MNRKRQVPGLKAQLVGWWRVLRRRCPKCNSDPARRFSCGVCHSQKLEQKYYRDAIWHDFLDGHGE